jgi:hypothetical protein
MQGYARVPQTDGLGLKLLTAISLLCGKMRVIAFQPEVLASCPAVFVLCREIASQKAPRNAHIRSKWTC